MKFRPVGSEWA